MKQLIILDFDDTIATGGFELYFQAYRKALEAVGAAESEKEERKMVYDFWGRPQETVMRILLGKYKERLPEAQVAYYAALLEGDASGLEEVPGALKALELLAKDYRLAIASAGDPTLIKETLLPRLGISQLFSQVLTGDELIDPTMGKPYPDLLLRLLSEQDCAAEDAVMVGASLYDMQMAVAAQVTPLAVLTGRMEAQEAAESGAEKVLPTLAHLPEAMEELALKN